MASVISGAAGAITGIATCADWSISPSVQVANPVASNTNLGPYKVVGNADWTGRYRTYGKVPPKYPGESLSFEGYTGAAKYTGTAIIEKVRLTGDIAGGGPLFWETDFGGNSALVRASSTAITDAGTPVMVSAAPCITKWAGTQIANVQRYTLELMMKLNTYAKGSSVIGRVASGITMANFTLDQLEADSTAELAEGATDVLLLYVDATTYWQLTYGVIESVEKNVPIEDGSIVPYRLSGGWSGWKTITGTPTKGTILKPGGVALWS